MRLALWLAAASTAFALPQGNTNPSACTQPRVRKSWHNLSKEERQEYIRAVKCLYEKPAQGSAYFPASQTRHDDFASLHINQTTAPDPSGNRANRNVVGPGIHFNGVFLPWHRYAVWVYETALIDECGYKGAQPFWDWSLDTSENGRSFDQSPIFDPVDGFGGNSRDGSVPDLPPGGPPNNGSNPIAGNCIGDGPFVALNSSMGPAWNLDKPNSHCIIRNFNVTLADGSLQWEKNVIPLLKETDFYQFTIKFSEPGTGAPAGVHGGGHSGVGGEMRNVWSSINDPLFFMHHAQIDHLWAIWQDLKPENFGAINGPIYPNGTGETTLDYPIYMAPYVAPDQPIRAVIDTQNKDGSGVLCYVYEKNEHPLPS